MFVGGVADFVVEEGLELRKEGVIASWAMTADTEEGVAAVLEVEESSLVGKLETERLVEPVCEGAGGVAGVVDAGDCGLAEHGVGVYVVVGLVDVVHVCSLLSADIWEADDFCRIQEFFDLIEVGVLILCIYGDGGAELLHKRHLAHCRDPFLDLEQIFVVVRDDQLKLWLFLVLPRRRQDPHMDKNNARQNGEAQAGDGGSEQRYHDDGR